MEIRIDLLKNQSQYIPQFAKILHHNIGKWFEDVNNNDVIQWLNEWINDCIPCAYVALDGVMPIGICSLQINDGVRTDLMPWLGDLCVIEEYQKRGIGQLLVNAVRGKAKNLGYSKLYILVPDPTMPEYYVRLGWRVIGSDVYNKHKVVIMESDL